MKSSRILPLLALALMSQNALAEEHVINAQATAWDPMVLFVQPGDIVKFLNMAGHDTETYEGMIPDGAKPWKSEMGDEGFAVKLEMEGAYIHKCNPHVSLGMIGAIIVGPVQPANMDAIDAALPNVKLAQNMVQRTIRKTKKVIEEKLKGS